MGFFYIINHGIPESITEAAAKSTLDFFHLPSEEKNKVYFSHEMEGYIGYNREQLNYTESVDLKERFRLPYRPSLDPMSTPSLIGSEYKEFPWEKIDQLPSFADSISECFISRLQLARQLLRTIALALELPEDYFDLKVAQPMAALALNYFPPLPTETAKNDEKSERLGLGSHTDFGLITLLWQDDSGGLQILSPDGEWLKAKPIPGSLICNMGDFMSMITDGKFISDVHKVKNENPRERISIPFFMGYGANEKIEIVESCRKNMKEPDKFQGLLASDWIEQRMKGAKIRKVGEDEMPVSDKDNTLAKDS